MQILKSVKRQSILNTTKTGLIKTFIIGASSFDTRTLRSCTETDKYLEDGEPHGARTATSGGCQN